MLTGSSVSISVDSSDGSEVSGSGVSAVSFFRQAGLLHGRVLRRNRWISAAASRGFWKSRDFRCDNFCSGQTLRVYKNFPFIYAHIRLHALCSGIFPRRSGKRIYRAFIGVSVDFRCRCAHCRVDSKERWRAWQMRQSLSLDRDLRIKFRGFCKIM